MGKLSGTGAGLLKLQIDFPSQVPPSNRFRNWTWYGLDIFNQYSEVNRLIIIGNGFDLAHGFKSSFLDFIRDYLIRILINICDNLSQTNQSLSIQGLFIKI